MTSEFGALFVVLGAAYFSVQGQKGGGCTGKKRGGVPAPHSLKSFVFRGLSLLIGFPRADTEKSGETIATPPKRGFLRAPIAALSTVPLSRPQGVAIVGIYPCGKARKRRPAERRGLSGEWPYGIAEEPAETDHGLEPVLAPGGRADELEKPRPCDGLYRLGSFQRCCFFGG